MGMQMNDLRKVVLVLYFLTMLLLTVIYMQGSLLLDPEATATISNAVQSANSQMSLNTQPLINVNIQENSVWAIIGLITVFFGFMWRIARSYAYD
jgi:hypothetical protein